MPDLHAHFALKATAVGATVVAARDETTARALAGAGAGRSDVGRRVPRDAAFARLRSETRASFADSADRLVAAKDGVLADPGAARARFVAAFAARGGVVHEAATAEDARSIVLRLLRERGVTLFAKGKSM